VYEHHSVVALTPDQRVGGAHLDSLSGPVAAFDAVIRIRLGGCNSWGGAIPVGAAADQRDEDGGGQSGACSELSRA